MIMTTPTQTHRGPARRRRYLAALATALLLCCVAALQVLPDATATQGRPAARPTIVLVHGAWADSSSWSGAIERLQADGYRVLAPSNPLRSLSTDSAALRTFLDTIDGPVVLVGHSYGASVITNAATGNAAVKALVYVNGSVPGRGETVGELAGPESALSVPDPTTIFDFVPNTAPPTPDGDVYLHEDVFLRSFATGLSSRQARVLWASQKPITLLALNEPSGPPAWQTIPSWYLVGTRDRVIPTSAQLAMAAKASSTVRRFDAGHLGLISDPAPVARIVEDAARTVR
jgi:pimeloyl-ACP methyl ester carboxylesterase